MKTVDQDFIKKTILHELLEQRRGIEINSSTSLASLNLDSFSLLSIAAEIEDEYKISLIKNAAQIEEMKKNMKTFGEFVSFINRKIDDATGTK
jgi:acyl carrier protein